MSFSSILRALCASARFFSYSQRVLSPRSPKKPSFSTPLLHSLRLCEILSLQSAGSLAKTPRSPRIFPRSRSHCHSHPLFALFAPLRDSFSPVSRFSRQDAKTPRSPRNCPIVAVIVILKPSPRSLRLCEILSLHSICSLAKIAKKLPYCRGDRHSQSLSALSAPLRDSLPPLNLFSRQDAKIAKDFSAQPQSLSFSYHLRALCASARSLSSTPAASLARTLSSPREFPPSHRHSHTIFALFASLRDSFSPVSRFSRQDAKIAKKLPYCRGDRHSQTLFALFASLRDSFSPVSRFSRQDAKTAKGTSASSQSSSSSNPLRALCASARFCSSDFNYAGSLGAPTDSIERRAAPFYKMRLFLLNFDQSLSEAIHPTSTPPLK